jgi:hypothetical protein
MELIPSGEKVKINGHEQIVLLDYGDYVYTIEPDEKEFSGIKSFDRTTVKIERIDNQIGEKDIYASWIESIIILIKWRDEATTKRKARAIQRVIDKKIEYRDRLGIIWLKNILKERGLKLSAW